MMKLDRRNVVLGSAIIFMFIASHSARAQTYTVLYSFAGGSDAANPDAGLIMDPAGNLYGTTGNGGALDIGTVFELDTSGKETHYSFLGNRDGQEPYAGLIRDGAGNLYGTTQFGGNTRCPFGSCGTVFKISKSGKETILYRFCAETNCTDGDSPAGSLLRDQNGNLYGTTEYGGDTLNCFPPYGCGTVFKLDSSGNETVLHTFEDHEDGGSPIAGLVADKQGNGYGTTFGGVFKINQTGMFTPLYSFRGPPDGLLPEGGVVLDAEGNLYGTTFDGGDSGTGCGGSGCGTVFELNTSGRETVLYNFQGTDGTGSHPAASLLRGPEGNLYGTAAWGGGGTGCTFYSGCGMVFELTTAGKLIVLHSFTGGADGALPYSNLIRDAKGNLYGTASAGGNPGCINGLGCGVVFKISPN